MQIPFYDMKRVYEVRQVTTNRSIERALSSGRYILGDEGSLFENEFAEYQGGGFAAGCASGTEALTLAIWALGVPKGSEVIIPALTAFPTASAVVMAGCVPTFADVNPFTGLLDPAEVEKHINPTVGAIIAVHLYGQMCPMEELRKLADTNGIPIIEDCAQAHGAMRKGFKAGAWGDIAAFSFYPTKNLAACGDAGLVFSLNEEIINRVKLLRNYGETQRYHHEVFGINSRLDEIQAAVLRDRLLELETDNHRRRELASIYIQVLADSSVLAMESDPDNIHAYHLFVVRYAERDKLIQHLQEQGVGVLIHYPIPLPYQPVFSYLGHASGEFPAAEQLCSSIASLPLYPELMEEEVVMVGELCLRLVG